MDLLESIIHGLSLNMERWREPCSCSLSDKTMGITFQKVITDADITVVVERYLQVVIEQSSCIDNLLFLCVSNLLVLQMAIALCKFPRYLDTAFSSLFLKKQFPPLIQCCKKIIGLHWISQYILLLHSTICRLPF